MPNLRYADVLLGESSLGLRTQGRGGEFIITCLERLQTIQRTRCNYLLYCTLHGKVRKRHSRDIALIFFPSCSLLYTLSYVGALVSRRIQCDGNGAPRVKKGTLRLQFHLGPFAPRTLSFAVDCTYTYYSCLKATVPSILLSKVYYISPGKGFVG